MEFSGLARMSNPSCPFSFCDARDELHENKTFESVFSGYFSYLGYPLVRVSNKTCIKKNVEPVDCIENKIYTLFVYKIVYNKMYTNITRFLFHLCAHLETRIHQNNSYNIRSKCLNVEIEARKATWLVIGDKRDVDKMFAVNYSCP